MKTYVAALVPLAADADSNFDELAETVAAAESVDVPDRHLAAGRKALAEIRPIHEVRDALTRAMQRKDLDDLEVCPLSINAYPGCFVRLMYIFQTHFSVACQCPHSEPWPRQRPCPVLA
jgi:hypothetical protein